MDKGNYIELSLTQKKMGANLSASDMPVSSFVLQKAVCGPQLKQFCEIQCNKLGAQSNPPWTHFLLL